MMPKLADAIREEARRAEHADGAKEGAGGPRRTPSAAKRSEPVVALDPAKDEWRVGDVRVKVAAAEITQPRVFKFSKPAGRIQEDLLLIRLSLHNGSSTKKIDYLKWDNPTARPKLVERDGHIVERGRADIGAMREAKEHQQPFGEECFQRTQTRLPPSDQIEFARALEEQARKQMDI